MKLHRLEIENINSLYGNHTVDFDKGLQGASLFLIHGPTGAGKSTLLDSIALALYGRTARLPNAVASATDEAGHEDPRQVMSRGQASASVSLVFSQEPVTGGPRRVFRAVWRADRARRKADGKLQSPVRELYRLQDPSDVSGEQLVGGSKVSEHKECFEEALCGMDFASFERMMMLPQGKFAEFLRSDTKEKAALLRAMLSDDIEIFTATGRRINEAKLEADSRLREFNAAIDALKQSSDRASEEPLDELKSRLAETRARGEEERKASDALKSRLEALQACLAARRELLDATARKEAAEQAITAAESELQALRLHEAGTAVRNAAAQLRPVLAAINEGERDAEEFKRSLGEISAELLEAEKQTETNQEKLREQLKEQKDAAPLIARARELNQKRTELSQTLTTIAASLKEDHEGLVAGQAELKRAKENLEKVVEEMKTRQAALAAMPTMGELDGAEDALTQAVENFREYEGARKAAELATTALSERLQQAETALTTESEGLETVRDELRQCDARAATLRKLLGEFSDQSELIPAALRELLAARTDAYRQRATFLQSQADTLREKREVISDLRAMSEAKAGESLSLRTEAERLRATVQTARENLHECRTSLRHFDQLLGMVEHVARLRDRPTEACALCGSHQHDRQHIQHLADELAEAESNRERLLAAVTEAETRLESESTELAQVQEMVREHERESSERQARIASIESDILTIISTSCDDDPSNPEPSELAERASLQLSDWLSALPSHQKNVDGLQEAEVRCDGLRKQLAVSEQRIVDTRQSVDALRSEYAGARENLAEHVARCATLEQALETAKSSALQLLGARVPAGETAATAALEILRTTRTEAAKQTEALAQLQQRQTDIHATIEGTQTRIDRAEAAVKSLTEQQTASTAELQEVQTARDANLPDVDVDEFAARLQNAVNDARDQQERLTATVAGVRSRLAAMQARLTSIQEHLKKRSDEKVDLQAKLDQALQASTFSALDEVEAATLDDDAVGRVSRKSTELTHALQAAVARTDDRAEAATRAAERVAVLFEDRTGVTGETTETLEALNESVREAVLAADESLESIRAEYHSLNERIKTQASLAEDLATRLNAREQLRARAARLKQLDSLVGGKDGKNFESRALALMLDRLLVTANDWLSTFSPRYRLRTAVDGDGVPTLDFAIEDLHHAGAQRPVTTLSGGETFMVSLSLALSLSSSRNLPYRIETLLIDEGFGTLDQETLAVVMSTLEALQERNGNTVGIISHVAGLSEQIPAQIRLGTNGNGRANVEVGVYSGLSGAGRV